MILVLIKAHQTSTPSFFFGKFSLASYPEKPEPINWDYYQQNISKPGLVDSFKKQFEAVSVPYPKDTVTPLMEEQKKKIVSRYCSEVQREHCVSIILLIFCVSICICTFFSLWYNVGAT